MGLLDGLLGAAMGALNNQGGHQGAGGGAGGALLNIALQMLANQGNGQAAGGGIGGLGGLLQSLQGAGLGDVAQSWIGKGSNLPISADQLSQVLGNDRIGQIAQQLGLSPDHVSEQLAGMLPDVVDKLTPGGEVPQGGLGDPQDLLNSLTRALRG
ncbi:MAG TPA: YidB family protein [Burkholderiaceae bacterium]|jgi:uncharacterized protein YidB (DUF937 family)|nr:YidB family protein [Burkholderiaceae bacterium]